MTISWLDGIIAAPKIKVDGTLQEQPTTIDFVNATSSTDGGTLLIDVGAGGGGGGGAPTDAQYLVCATSTGLSAERVLAGSASVSVTNTTGVCTVAATFGTSATTCCVGNDSRLSDARSPTAHTTSHKHGGSDEIATATPAANVIPKAGADGKLAAGFIPTIAIASHGSTHQNGGSDEIATATASANAIPKSGATGKIDIGWLPTGTTSTTVAAGNDVRIGAPPSTGFENRTDSTISVSGSTFTITGSNFVIWYAHDTKALKSTESKTITNIVGAHWIYYDTSGVLQIAPPASGFPGFDKCLVARIYWDGTKALDVVDERHGAEMPEIDHELWHNTVGPRYSDGYALSQIATGVGGANGDCQIILTSGSHYDEDIKFTVTRGSSGVPWTQEIGSGATAAKIPVYYRMGADGHWTKDVSTDYPCKPSGAAGSRIGFNKDTAGTWSVADPGANDAWVAYWICATDCQAEPIIAIMGQRFDATGTAAQQLASADTNNIFSNLSLGTAPCEFKVLYRLLIQTSVSFGNTIKAYIKSGTYLQDLRSVSSMPTGTFTLTSHNALSGRDAAAAHPATAVSVSAAAFVGTLSALDTDVQAALATIDTKLPASLDGGGTKILTYDTGGVPGLVDNSFLIGQVMGITKSGVGYFDPPDWVTTYEGSFSTPDGASVIPPSTVRNYGFDTVGLPIRVFDSVPTCATGGKITSMAGVLPFQTDRFGNLYVDIISEGAGNYHANIYDDRNHLIGHTASFSTTGAKAIIADGAPVAGGGVLTGATITIGTASAVTLEMVSFYKYFVVTSVSDTAVHMAGAPLTQTTNALKMVQLGHPGLVKEIDIGVKGSYAATTSSTVFASKNFDVIPWSYGNAHLCKISAGHITNDTGATQPKVCMVHNAVVTITSGSELTMATSTQHTLAEINAAAARVTHQTPIELRVVAGTNGNARDLSGRAVYVCEGR